MVPRALDISFGDVGDPTTSPTRAVLQFVSDPQNGFVPGGFIAENIMLLKLVQAYLEEKKAHDRA